MAWLTAPFKWTSETWAHQIRQDGCATILSVGLQLNALANFSKFDNVTFTRAFAGECTSSWSIINANSSPSFSHQDCPAATKNCCSGLKPATGRPDAKYGCAAS